MKYCVINLESLLQMSTQFMLFCLLGTLVRLTARQERKKKLHHRDNQHTQTIPGSAVSQLFHSSVCVPTTYPADCTQHDRPDFTDF